MLTKMPETGGLGSVTVAAPAVLAAILIAVVLRGVREQRRADAIFGLGDSGLFARDVRQGATPSREAETGS